MHIFFFFFFKNFLCFHRLKKVTFRKLEYSIFCTPLSLKKDLTFESIRKCTVFKIRKGICCLYYIRRELFIEKRKHISLGICQYINYYLLNLHADT